jgi:hypothetical protein
LMWRYFYLEKFTKGDISDDFLRNLQTDFNTIRKAGLKIIPRFAYTAKMKYPVGDAPVNIVLRHIEQLKPLLQKNVDIIMTIQAGFIGAWGECYYTDYFSEFENPEIVTEEQFENRKKILLAELDALPKTRMIQNRYVKHIIKFSGDSMPVKKDEAYSGSLKARLAHHNDCFQASADNYGTYKDIINDKNYLRQHSKYVLVGGETCHLNPPLSDCKSSIQDMIDMHWSFMNLDYQPAVLNSWKTQGCINEISKNLGYRYRLVYSRIQEATNAGAGVKAEIKLINEGWSNPVNPRSIELILRNKITREEYMLPNNEDIRLNELNDTITLSFEGGINGSITNGEYEVFLNLPDPEPSLYNNPMYSIRTANPNIWDASGYNKLNHTLVINDSVQLPSYSGKQYLTIKKKYIVSH